MKRWCVALALTILAGCDEPAPLTCSEPPIPVSCCAMDPTLPECRSRCDVDPTLPECRELCTDDPTHPDCRVPCSTDPEAPHCVPSTVSGPSVDVEVIRDSLGIPHIFAATDEDAMWASGYMQAHDRLFQMEMARRQATGRRAEVLGAGYVGDDTLMRTVDIEGWSEQGVMRMREERPELFRFLVAWTAGINARVDEILSGEAPTPSGFTELGVVPSAWRIVDGAAVGKLLLFGSSNQLENDILATIIRDYLPEAWATIPLLMPLEPELIVPEVDRPMTASAPIVAEPPMGARPSRDRASRDQASRVLPPDAAERLRRFHERVGRVPGEGSTNWAVAGRFTENGRSMIAGDPHQPLRTPSLFWAHHMHSDEGLDVVGFNYVGAPGVHLGHNAHIAWTATLNYPDMMDLWDVRATPTQALIGDREERIVARTETIRVAGGEPVEVTVERVPGYGVLLPEDLAPLPIGRGRLLFNWTGFAATDDFGGFFGIDTAGSVDDFESAVDGLEIGAFNWIVADQSDILYMTSMWLPSRSGLGPDRLPYTVLDGDDAGSFWTGELVPRELLPRSRATERGWLVSANNDPFGGTVDGDPTNDPYYFGVYFDPGTRARRIAGELERLTARGTITTDDFEALQTDTHSILADHMIALLTDAWSRVDTDEALAAYRGRTDLGDLVTALEAWDRRMDREASEPVPFTGLVYFFAKLAVEDEFSLVFGPILDAETVYLLKLPLLAAEGAWPGSADVFQGGLPSTVLAALDATASWLTTRFGGSDPSNYRWADFHCTRFRGEYPVAGLDSECIPSDGGDGTVDVSGANFLVDGGGVRDQLRSGGGPIYRMVATFGADGAPEARVTFPRGNVEEPDSPWFTNNVDDWIEGRYRSLPFRTADIEADEQERLTLRAR